MKLNPLHTNIRSRQEEMFDNPISTFPKSATADSAYTIPDSAEVPPFSPHRLIHNGHLQTVLALVKPKEQDAYYVDQPIVIDAGPDLCDSAVTSITERRVRLLCYFTPRRTTYARGLVLMLHGWLGCSHSNYNRATTAALTAAGYDVVRLNMRDHGPDYHFQSHALNPGLFLGILIEEVHYAAQQLAQLSAEQPFYIVGVSMGGNFALRMALRHVHDPIANLQKVIAINPALNPASATDNVDRYPFYRRFFRKRWLTSLLAKERHYPALYDFAALSGYPTIRGMTEYLIQHYGARLGGFHTADDYFSQYAVTPAALRHISVPTEIITAEDDPIIDVTDFSRIPSNELLQLQVHPSGGHVGYVSLFPTAHYLPQVVIHALRSAPSGF